METNKELFLDIDYLKNTYKRLYYFGLGFIQLVLNGKERLHFYSESLKDLQTNDEIHNHRYNFESVILKGTLYEHVYNLNPGDKFIIKNESCGKDIIVPNIEIPCNVYMIDNNEHSEGNCYFRSYNQFHKVEYFENTITYLKRSEIILPYAQVIYPKNSIKICPLSTKFTEPLLWEIIDETIKK